jgi:hypothetical protein
MIGFADPRTWGSSFTRDFGWLAHTTMAVSIYAQQGAIDAHVTVVINEAKSPELVQE